MSPFSDSRPICALLGGLAAVRRDRKPKPAVCALFLSPRQLAAGGDTGLIDSISSVRHAEVTRHD